MRNVIFVLRNKAVQATRRFGTIVYVEMQGYRRMECEFKGI